VVEATVEAGALAVKATARRAVEVVENQDVVESSNSPGENSARLEVIEDILAAIKAEFELDKGE
jgi:hypothetical protein